MKTRLKLNQLFLNYFSASSWRICRAGPVLAVGLFGSLLTAQGQDPKINPYTYPMDTNASLGATVSFRVYATSTNPPITYQWLHEGTNVPGATSQNLVLTNLTVAHAGGYMAMVSNASGDFTNSRTAMLTVDPTFILANRARLGDDGFLKVGSDGPLPYWLDYNGDGWLDVMLVRGWTGGALQNELYRNNQDGTFTRITNMLTQVAGHWNGLVGGDFDGDGDVDYFMAVKRPGTGTLFVNERNQGREDFVAVPHPSATGEYAACADFNGDGWMDLALTSWGTLGSGSVGTNLLLKNVYGQFEIVRDTPFALKNEFIEWHHWVDIDGDGDVDFFGATSPFGANARRDVLFENQGASGLLRITDNVLVNQTTPNVMAGFADYDNDGDQDVFLPYADSILSVLYRNIGGWAFEQDLDAPSLDPTQAPLCPTWVDYDNDGDLDLFVTHDKARCRLFNNDGGGKLNEVWVGNPTSGGAAYHGQWEDYNNDGFPDLLLGRLTSQHFLFLNNLPQTGNRNHWLKIRLVGKASNPNGVGAKVRVQANIGGKTVEQMRQLGILPMANVGFAHFGLGDATSVTTLRIEWPSGIVQEIPNVAPDQFLTVVECQGYTNACPSFTGATPDTSGLQLTFTEPEAGFRYVIEASSDLVHWTKLKACTSTGGTAQFTDPVTANRTQRFYRLQVP
ncbi:MAG: VCBS repeat-containing protein [Verrucomicrobiae bacterium]|nr:VCBS repeat-containing protein [Verrucomicrobiae bacterium]